MLTAIGRQKPIRHIQRMMKKAYHSVDSHLQKDDDGRGGTLTAVVSSRPPALVSNETATEIHIMSR